MNKVLIFFLALLVLNSCDSRRLSVFDYSKQETRKKDLILQVNSNENYPNWLSLKGKINFINNHQNLTLNISIKNKKDSLIWVSFSAPFGIELLRAQLTNDSIYFINRSNKTWMIKPLSEMDKFLKTSISFNEIQDMIAANPRIIKKNIQVFEGKKNYTVKSSNAEYKVSKANFRIISAIVENEDNKFFYEFSSFDLENNFPKRFYLKMIGAENFESTLNYSKIKYNIPQKTPFVIPKSYEEIN